MKEKKKDSGNALPPYRTVELATTFVGLTPGGPLREAAFRFTADMRREVELCYAGCKLVTSMDAFIVDVERTLGQFAVLAAQDKGNRQQKKASPSKLSLESRMRKKLARGESRLTGALSVLDELLNDPEARLRLDAACRARMTQEAMVAAINSPDFDGVLPGSLEARYRNAHIALTELLEPLRSARTLRRTALKGGRAAEPLPGALVKNLGELVDKHFHVRATTTAEGPFERLVKIGLRAVGWRREDVHRLITTALSDAKVQKPPSLP